MPEWRNASGMIRHSKHHHIDIAFVYGLAVISVLALSNVERMVTRVQETILPMHTQHVETSPLFKSEAFSHVVVKGKAYVVYDIVDEKVIAGKNQEVVLPLASITKVMMAVTARTHYGKKQHVTINPASVDDGYDLGLKKGQVFDLDELLKYTLVFSSNDGAQAIADGLGGRASFVNQMNEDAKSLGLLLHFTHPAGLDEGNKIGGEGSALSVAKLAAIAKKDFPELFDATTKRRVSVKASTGSIIGIPNTNQEVINLTGIEASKTGYTDKAGGNLVVIVDIAVGHPVAIVILGSTHEERFSDVEILYKALQKSLEK
jgi:D-alanyl-D-alanine carboxypeptidase